MTNSNLNPIHHMQTNWQHPWYKALEKQDSTTTSDVPLTPKPNKDATGQTCIKCGAFKPLEEFAVDKSRSGWRRSECKTCLRHAARVRNQLKKTAPPKPDNCELCGKEAPRLILDHCHETDTFRGWICDKCNTGLGSFYDNVASLTRAIQYLNETTNRC